MWPITLSSGLRILARMAFCGYQEVEKEQMRRIMEFRDGRAGSILDPLCPAQRLEHNGCLLETC